MLIKNIKQISVLFITAIVSALIFCTIACQPTKAFASSPDLDPDVNVSHFDSVSQSINMTITSSKCQAFFPQEFSAETLKQAFKKYWKSAGHTSEFQEVMEKNTTPNKAIFWLYIKGFKWINSDSLCQDSLNEAVKDIFNEHPEWRKGPDFNIYLIKYISASCFDVNFNGSNCIHDIKTLEQVVIEHSDFHDYDNVIHDCPKLWAIVIKNTYETYDTNEANKYFKNVRHGCNLDENDMNLFYNQTTQKWQNKQP